MAIIRLSEIPRSAWYRSLEARDQRVARNFAANIAARDGDATDVSTEDLDAFEAEGGAIGLTDTFLPRMYMREILTARAEAARPVRAALENRDVEALAAMSSNSFFALTPAEQRAAARLVLTRATDTARSAFITNVLLPVFERLGNPDARLNPARLSSYVEIGGLANTDAVLTAVAALGATPEHVLVGLARCSGEPDVDALASSYDARVGQRRAEAQAAAEAERERIDRLAELERRNRELEERQRADDTRHAVEAGADILCFFLCEN